MSGHEGGYGVFGEGNGTITWKSLLALAQALPRAAGQVEDLHVAACYSGGAYLERMYLMILPSLRTIWAYSGTAPGSGNGATIHLAAWDQATRGRGTRVAEAAARLKQQGVPKAENISARSMDEATKAFLIESEGARAAVQEDYDLFENYFLGRIEVENTQIGPLREYYDHVQRALQIPDLDPWQRAALEKRRDLTLRTLFYSSNIRRKFQEEYGAQIATAYRALGLSPPISRDSRAPRRSSKSTCSYVRNGRDQQFPPSSRLSWGCSSG